MVFIVISTQNDFVLAYHLVYKCFHSQATEMFFRRHFGKELSFEERMEFVNLWYLLICINDILIILGSILKIGLESKVSYLDEVILLICELWQTMGNHMVVSSQAPLVKISEGEKFLSISLYI